MTPLFCAGTDPGSPELRIPSFKGALRFWWRALAWSRCGGNLDEIHRQENELFGSAAGGQSRVHLRLSASGNPKTISCGELLRVPKTNHPVGEGARYLGYGVMEAFASRRKNTKAGQLTRACFKAPFEFTVGVRGRDLTKHQQESLKNAMIVLGMIGGMGAKSRKGYGSLVLRSLSINGNEGWIPPKDPAELKKKIVDLRGDQIDHRFPQFTAISGWSRHVLLRSDVREPLELLNLIGRELVRYRSWGRNGKILDGKIDSERNFKDDHDLMKRNWRERSAHPRRVAFGLPHNYGQSSNQTVGPSDQNIDRRASPLFLHIHECGAMPVAVLSLLPARFLPQGRSSISVGGSQIKQKPEKEFYRPIHDFLDRLLDPCKRKEPFRGASEIRS